VHDMLQRMNELATKSANGTNSQEERDYIQSEVDALINEIDRVSETTKFNEIYLLKGEGNKDIEVALPDVEEVKMTAEYNSGYGVNSGVEAKSATNANTIKALTDGNSAQATNGLFVVEVADDGTVTAGTTGITDPADLAKYFELDKNGAVKTKDGVKFYSIAANASNEYGAQVVKKEVAAASVEALFQPKSTMLLDGNGTAAKAVTADKLTNYFNDDGTYKGGLYYVATKADATVTPNINAGDKVEVGADQISKFVKVTPKKEGQTGQTKTKTVAGDLKFNLHVGAEGNTANKIEVKIQAMSAAGIGVDGLKSTGVKTEDAATAAIETIKSAIKTVSQQRSDLGAVQNRLEHTINNLDNIVENTQSAESAIRDTDMATEMVKYANNNILAQAGQAMLAQANQANQGVLSLLS
ncbi:MAG: flagellar hook protein, partial [Clostridium sp.]|nr:flagellar hook protein [Clostridium sp.]